MGAHQTTTPQPRIYVACLAAYNNGYLHGEWVEASQEPWSIYDEVKAMLAASPMPGGEDWAIHDYEGFGELRIGESTGFDRVSELATFIVEHGEIGAALLDHFNGDLDEAREAMADRYLGQHASLTDYVQGVTEETAHVPYARHHHIDHQAIARDAELNGELFTIATAFDVVHVFRGVGRSHPDEPAKANCSEREGACGQPCRRDGHRGIDMSDASP